MSGAADMFKQAMHDHSCEVLGRHNEVLAAHAALREARLYVENAEKKFSEAITAMRNCAFEMATP